MIQVRAHDNGGFRRCNFRFGPEWTTFEDGYFSKDEMEVLEAEPKLSVRRVESVPEDVEIHAKVKADVEKKAEDKADDKKGLFKGKK